MLIFIEIIFKTIIVDKETSLCYIVSKETMLVGELYEQKFNFII